MGVLGGWGGGGGGGGSVQSTAGSRGVRMSSSNGSNAGYTVFRGTVQDYWLPTPLACFPFTSPTVRHRVPSGFNWAIPPVDPSLEVRSHENATASSDSNKNSIRCFSWGQTQFSAVNPPAPHSPTHTKRRGM
jgi:hypothetical protein